jgi:hypothetical protein
MSSRNLAKAVLDDVGEVAKTVIAPPVERRTLPPPNRSEQVLRSVLLRYSPEERAAYDYWMDLALPHETTPRQAACFSVDKVGTWRRSGAFERAKERAAS